MKKVKGANGEELDLEVGGGVGSGDEEAGLGEEETASEGTQALGDPTGVEEEEENLDLDWKAARAHLKDADTATGWSIEDYDARANINALKKRYNDKERTQSLFDAIMALQ